MHLREEIVARWMDVIYFGMVYMADPPLNFMLSFMLEITRTPYRPKNIKPHPFADASVCYPSDTHPLIVRVCASQFASICSLVMSYASVADSASVTRSLDFVVVLVGVDGGWPVGVPGVECLLRVEQPLLLCPTELAVTGE